MTDKSNYLGEGTYGRVIKTGNVATKTFILLPSLIQEYAAGKYLSNVNSIVKVLDVNFEKLTLTMELYKGSIRKWNYTKRTMPQKVFFIKETIKALINLHDIGIVHGDIKPGNILANWDSDGDITKIVIADLGFLAPNKYSKVQYTAPLYRDSQYEPIVQHDIYSLGIIMIELFGGEIPRKEKKNKDEKVKYYLKELLPYANKIEDEKLRNLVKLMISDNKDERPTARYILRNIFDETVPLSKHPGFPKTPSIHLDINKQNELEDIFKMYGEKEFRKNNIITYEIKRTKIGYLACLNFICSHKIESEKHNIYIASTLVILSSIFGEEKFTIEDAINMSNTNSKIIYKSLKELLNDENYLKSIFFTKTSCF